MKKYIVTVRAPGIEKPFEQLIKVYSYNEWMAAIQAFQYSIEAGVCEPQISEVKEENEDRTETVIPFSR